MEDSQLTAPFSGLVAKTLVENFQNIQAKQQILLLQDDSSLEMVIDIPENDYAELDKPLSASRLNRMLTPEILISSFPDSRFKASFKEAAATADPVTRTFEVTLGFSPPPHFSILPGMTARLVMTKAPKESESDIMIPARSVVSDDNGNATVWLIDLESKRVKRHPIEIGEMSGRKIRVTNGLKTGDVIAASGVHQLREDMAVKKYERP